MNQLKIFWKKYDLFYKKHNLYLGMVAVLMFYLQELVYILNRFYGDKLVRMFYFRFTLILIIFILCSIIFYYKFFRKINARNCVFVLLSVITLYSLTLFIKSRELSLPIYTLDLIFYLGNLCLVGILLSILLLSITDKKEILKI